MGEWIKFYFKSIGITILVMLGIAVIHVLLDLNFLNPLDDIVETFLIAYLPIIFSCKLVEFEKRKAAIISTASFLSALFILYLIMHSPDLSRNTVGGFEKFIYRLILLAGIIAANRKIWKEYR